MADEGVVLAVPEAQPNANGGALGFFLGYETVKLREHLHDVNGELERRRLLRNERKETRRLKIASAVERIEQQTAHVEACKNPDRLWGDGYDVLAPAEEELTNAIADHQAMLDEEPVETEDEKAPEEYDDDDAEAVNVAKTAADKARALFFKKRQREAALAKLTDEERVNKEKSAKKRREDAAEKKATKEKMCKEHPKLLEYKQRCEVLIKSEAQKDEAIASYQARMERAKKYVCKVNDKLRGERAQFMEWINTPAGKPTGWDPTRMLSNYECFTKMAGNSLQSSGQAARKSHPETRGKSAKRAAAESDDE